MVLNLFIGIVVDAMQQQSTRTREAVIDVTVSENHSLMSEIGALRAELPSSRAPSTCRRYLAHVSLEMIEALPQCEIKFRR